MRIAVLVLGSWLTLSPTEIFVATMSSEISLREEITASIESGKVSEAVFLRRLEVLGCGDIKASNIRRAPAQWAMALIACVKANHGIENSATFSCPSYGCSAPPPASPWGGHPYPG